MGKCQKWQPNHQPVFLVSQEVLPPGLVSVMTIALGRFVGDLRGHDGNAKEAAHQGLEEQESQAMSAMWGDLFYVQKKYVFMYRYKKLVCMYIYIYINLT